jgi:hypothetical protein
MALALAPVDDRLSSLAAGALHADELVLFLPPSRSISVSHFFLRVRSAVAGSR